MNDFIVANMSCPYEIMRFILVYRGPLSASQAKGSTKRSERKQIREQITPQLEKLWAVKPALKQLKMSAYVPKRSGLSIPSANSPFDDGTSFHKTNSNYVNLLEPIERGGHLFQPLVRKSLDLTCKIDVLFLRQEQPGNLIKKAGDLDNRIKTLLDAMEVPSPDTTKYDGDELEEGEINYRLFESDSLVRGINIDSERLLLPETIFPNEVHLVIEVKVIIEKIGEWNMCLR